jgi:hypothetical protein
LRRGADGEHLGVRRHVVKLARAVAGGGDDLSVADNHRADRNLAARSSGLRLFQRDIHEA